MVKPDKTRYVWVYLPSKADKDRWAERAEKAKAPLSKFVIDIVENALADDIEIQTRGELIKELTKVREENKEMAKELKLKNIVLEQYEKELKRYRSEAFLEENFKGIRKYSQEIISLFKRYQTIDSYRLLEALGIDPSDSELVKAVSTELEGLETYGLVIPTPRGWKWQG
ncbi:MAG: hypothetical protein MUO26_11495 [Methanotrichaceae archaeon]|nr:hypothetical protein [Methanotrichaceae archaeon]